VYSSGIDSASVVSARGKVHCGGARVEVAVGETVGMAVSVSATCVGKSGGRGVSVTTAKVGNDDTVGIEVFSTASELGLMFLLVKNREVIKINPTINKIPNTPFDLCKRCMFSPFPETFNSQRLISNRHARAMQSHSICFIYYY
jgi:hypothetical protein